MNSNLKILIVSILVFLPRIAISAPSISGVSGVFTHGGAVVITGSSFGSKSTPAPIDFEQFEDSVEDGTDLEDESVWNVAASAEVKYNTSSQRTINSTLNVKDRLRRDYSPGGPFSRQVFSSAGSKIISFWVYMTIYNLDATGDWQWKVWRILTEDQHTAPPGILNQSWWNSDGSFARFYFEKSGMSPAGSPGGFTYKTDQWVYVEALIKECSDIDIQDGEAYFKVMCSDGTVTTNQFTATATRTTSNPDILDWIRLGYGMENAANADNEIYVFFDDIYIDNSWARVAIGNAAVYTNSTHIEMQSPIAWASGEITITANQGSFSINDTAYIFVFDSDGTASDGYEITIGDGTISLSGSQTITAGGSQTITIE